MYRDFGEYESRFPKNRSYLTILEEAHRLGITPKMMKAWGMIIKDACDDANLATQVIILYTNLKDY